jgi:Asp-tRNA(Asn)/Glu-tRNA(Gln) amidotransferase A subunit family amidase
MAERLARADLGVAATAAAIRRGEATAEEVLEACLARTAATDDEIQAWTTVAAETARAEARARDGDVRAGRPLGPLIGVPVGIKDIIDVAGLPTTSGAPAFAHTLPSRDAELVARLRAAGAVIVGKTVATQFAFLDAAPTRNPWSLDRTPGGSSSGSAAAIAAGHVPAAIGTQTIGSILRPAAFCGVVGLKGGHGDVPLGGVRPLSPSLDHAGPLARSVADAARVEGVLMGRAIPADAATRPPRLVLTDELLDLADEPMRDHLEAVTASLEAAGATVVREPLPAPLAGVLEAGYTILEAEAAAEHRATFEEHAAEYGPKIAGLVAAGLRRTPSEVDRAQAVRAAFAAAVVPWLARFDALLSPVARAPAPRLGGGTGDPTLCAPWSYAGVPAISIPSGLDADGLPLAVQLVGARDGLEPLLGAAAWCEHLLGFDARPGSGRQ